MKQLASRRSTAQILAIIVAVVLQIGATFLPQLGMGDPIGERSDSVRTLITPSGWAFAIWGPLFFGSAAFAMWQALPSQRNNDLVGRIGWAAMLALGLQGVWAIYTQFANLTVISAIVIIASLVGLLSIMRTMTHLGRDMTGTERLVVGVTFSALAAWLTAATIVNISASLVYHGVMGSPETGAQFPAVTAAIVAVGGAIAALATYRSRGNPWYAAVFCWALTAIYFRGGQEAGIIAAACIVSGVVVIKACIAALRVPANRRRWLG